MIPRPWVNVPFVNEKVRHVTTGVLRARGVCADNWLWRERYIREILGCSHEGTRIEHSNSETEGQSAPTSARTTSFQLREVVLLPPFAPTLLRLFPSWSVVMFLTIFRPAGSTRCIACVQNKTRPKHRNARPQRVAWATLRTIALLPARNLFAHVMHTRSAKT